MIKSIKREIDESIKVKSEILNDNNLLSQIEYLTNEVLESLNNGGKIIFCGNGGSFADSQHLSAEFVSRLRFDRAPLPSIALGTNNSNITAIANDYGYEEEKENWEEWDEEWEDDWEDWDEYGEEWENWDEDFAALEDYWDNNGEYDPAMDASGEYDYLYEYYEDVMGEPMDEETVT